MKYANGSLAAAMLCAAMALVPASSALAGPGASARQALRNHDGSIAGSYDFVPGPAYEPALLIVDDEHKDGYSIMVELWWKRGAKKPQQICADNNGSNKGPQVQCLVSAPSNAKIWFYIAEAHCKSKTGPCKKRKGHWAGPQV